MRTWLIGLVAWICLTMPSAAAEVTLQFMETTYYLKDICMLDADTGWAVGAPHWDASTKNFRGTVLKTTDGGQTWTPQNPGVAVTLRAVSFVDAQTGWAAGEQGALLHTDNGGDTWLRQTVATSAEFRALAFIDANTGWATGITVRGKDIIDQEIWQAGIWHTTDGGTTWRAQTIENAAGILNRIDFSDARNGWAVGGAYDDPSADRPQNTGAVYHTSDGGTTWQRQFDTRTDFIFTGIDFIDPQKGWCVGFKGNSGVDGGTIYATDDGGSTWHNQGPDRVLWDVQFINASQGYATGCMYGAAWGPPVLRTTDGGETWEEVRMDRHDGEGFYALAVGEQFVITVGDHDLIGRSDHPWDSCQWTAPEPSCSHCDCLFEQAYLNRHYKLEDICFIDRNNGWAAGSRSYAPALWGQVILHTTDGGDNWQTQYESPPDMDDLFSYTHRIDQIRFIDDQIGWAVGGSRQYYESGWIQKGAILHTTNGGRDWQLQGDTLYAARQLEFSALEVIDAHTVWALWSGNSSDEDIQLAYTDDSGASWQWVDTGYTGLMRIGFAIVQGDLAFADAQNGWAVGGQGQVLRTSDGGLTWTQQTLSDFPNRTLAVAIAADKDNGFVAGEGLFGTSDGGTTWNQILQGDISGSTDNHAITFLDGDLGAMAGANGRLLVTNDAGGHWRFLASGTQSDLLGVSLVDQGHAWAAGGAGTILAFTIPDPPQMQISPASHAFGQVSAGTTASQTFTITNSGADDLALGTLTLSGADSEAFALANDNCSGQILTATASATVAVEFTPLKTGTHQASLQIPSDDPLAPLTQVPLSGITGEGDDSGDDGQPRNDAVSGLFSGTFTGDQTGMWITTVDDSGQVDGMVWIAERTLAFSISATVDIPGTFTLQVGPGVAVQGEVQSDGKVQGTWQFDTLSGRFAGDLAMTDSLSAHAGTYTGTISGEAQGQLTLQIASDGAVSGEVDGQEVQDSFSGYISDDGIVIALSDEGVSIQGSMDSQGNLNGVWYDPVKDASGTASARLDSGQASSSGSGGGGGGCFIGTLP
jgi:photosystem II stability/assembly factor-like uncharacterized protein